MILIIGAPGNVGAPLVTELVAAGRQVRAVAVDDAAATALRGLGVHDVVLADLRHPETLPAAFAGVQRLGLITPFVPDQGELEIAALDAAAAAGVQHVVKLSPTMVDAVRYPQTPANAAPHQRSEHHLGKLGLSATVVRAESFVTNLFGQVAPLSAGMLVYPTGDSTVAWIDPRDIAAVMAVQLAGPVPPTGHISVLEVTGPESLTAAAVAERIGAILRTPVQHVDAPPQAWRDNLVGTGFPAYWADALVEMFAAYRAYGDIRTDTVEAVLGRPPRRIDDFVRDQLAPAVAAARAGDPAGPRA